jgi:ubiquinone/menaquinone biosynthesis C-methylase UbiE
MRRSFDWMAKPYATLERILFGDSFQRIRTALVHELDGASSVLVLGEGDGRFTKELLTRNPSVVVTVLDGSGEMLRVAQARTLPWRERVTYVHADAVDWVEHAVTSGQTFDAVVTTFFLDCLTEEQINRLFAAATRLLTGKRWWLWSDLVVPSSSAWRRFCARAILKTLYVVFRMTTNISARHLVDPSEYFASHGWKPRVTTYGLGGILKASVFSRTPT